MPKTIISQRNPLTARERKAYEANKKRAAWIRQQLVAHFRSRITYVRTFTEARAGGVCRSKLWRFNMEGSREVRMRFWDKVAELERTYPIMTTNISLHKDLFNNSNYLVIEVGEGKRNLKKRQRRGFYSVGIKKVVGSK